MFEKGLLATGLSKFSWPEVRRHRFLFQPAGLPKLECRVWIRWQSPLEQSSLRSISSPRAPCALRAARGSGKMPAFVMSLAGSVRPILATAVVAHGTTDFDAPAWPLIYTLAALVPVPGEALLALFCAASCVHFAEDTNEFGSLMLHGTVAAIGVRWGMPAAFDAMLGYLGCVHMPLHYRRCWDCGRRRVLTVAASCTAALVGAMCIGRVPSHLVLNSMSQRLVLAHVACEATHPRRIALVNGGSSTRSSSEWTAKIERHDSAEARPKSFGEGASLLYGYKRVAAGPRPKLGLGR